MASSGAFDAGSGDEAPDRPDWLPRLEQTRGGVPTARAVFDLPGVRVYSQSRPLPGHVEVGQLAERHAIIVCLRRGPGGEISYGYDTEDWRPWEPKPAAFVRLIPAGCAARLRFRDTLASDYVAIFVDDSRFAELRREAGASWWAPNGSRMRIQRDPFVVESALAIRRVLESPAVATEMAVDALVTGIVAHLLSGAGVEFGKPSNGPDRRVEHARALIAERLPERLTLTGLAREVGASPFHLARLFRRETGLSMHTYLVAARIERAKQLLDDGDRRIVEVALDCGFASHSHFSDAFRRATGLTPSEYRGRRR
jgi:AraC-like DNA-binding protein